MKDEIVIKLEKIATSLTIPFCLSCYTNAPNGKCPYCHSDDLAYHINGVGVDWKINFAIEHILRHQITPININEVYEELIRSCYPETTQVGWMIFDTVDLMKNQDPASWAIARDEYINCLESNEEIVSFDVGATYYWAYDIESFDN